MLNNPCGKYPIRAHKVNTLKKNTTFLRAIMMAVTSFLATSVFAWSDNIALLKDDNTLCKLEPESQCTQSVRIGLEAPGIDWHESSMAQIRLDGANLRGANLSRSILQLANLKGANLMLTNLEGAHLHAANLQNANLMMANLAGASLLDADLRGANLQGANLSKTILIQARFDGATWIDGRICAIGSVGECR
jgi:uncharacterized protein YjbI with pentapeptide repeats